MSISNESPVSRVDLIELARPYWLPPDGLGNGLDALFWATIADVPRHNAPFLLAALRKAGIPGWTAPITHHSPHSRSVDAVPETYRIWVSTSRLGDAEDVLMRSLNDDPALEPIAERQSHAAIRPPITRGSIR